MCVWQRVFGRLFSGNSTFDLDDEQMVSRYSVGDRGVRLYGALPVRPNPEEKRLPSSGCKEHFNNLKNRLCKGKVLWMIKVLYENVRGFCTRCLYELRYRNRNHQGSPPKTKCSPRDVFLVSFAPPVESLKPSLIGHYDFHDERGRNPGIQS
ncbi:hypothetical protein DPX16_4081 [Anabarilius grahami]|uniref:Uncharacterized protein n=1 Tax=Anabarilius grahami TaxID=495550 RepID=A0A3N0XY99_ANAGA|nr:hypothetical protein DPX16_4081 [Anabarilius grahami]